MDAPRDSHDSTSNPMEATWKEIWYPHATSMGQPLGIPRDSLASIGSTSVGLSWDYNIRIGVGWVSHGTALELEYPIRLSWTFHGTPMGFTWDCHGTCTEL